MANRRQTRELALQALYQLDARGEGDFEHVEASVRTAPFSDDVRQDAIQLARSAWRLHGQADDLSRELAPAWPPNRQPPVDRSIIRLAYAEMAGGELPPAIAINEAVELAKLYGSERSPAFVNGVLDKMAKRIREIGGAAATESQATPEIDITAEIPDLPDYTPPA